MSQRSKRDQGNITIVPIATTLATAAVLGAGAIFLHKRKIQSSSRTKKVAVLGDKSNGKSTLISLITGDDRKPVEGVPKVWKTDKWDIEFWEIPAYLGEFYEADKWWHLQKLDSYDLFIIAVECRFDSLNVLWTVKAHSYNIPVFVGNTDRDRVIEKNVINEGKSFDEAVKFIKARDESDLRHLINYDSTYAKNIRKDPERVKQVFGPSNEIPFQHFQLTKYKELNGRAYNYLELELMKKSILETFSKN